MSIRPLLFYSLGLWSLISVRLSESIMPILSKFKLASACRSKSLLIVFQSMNAFLYKPENLYRFEMENTFHRLGLNIDLLFVKDPSPHLFYLQYFQETVDLLEPIASQYDYVICTGYSAGGWASMLYGSLLNADLVVAINPMTSLICPVTGNNLVVEHNASTSSYFESGKISKDLLDVMPYISGKSRYYLNGTRHQGSYEGLSVVEKLHDIYNFERMQGLPNVSWLDFSVDGYGDGRFQDLLSALGMPI